MRGVFFIAACASVQAREVFPLNEGLLSFVYSYLQMVFLQ